MSTPDSNHQEVPLDNQASKSDSPDSCSSSNVNFISTRVSGSSGSAGVNSVGVSHKIVKRARRTDDSSPKSFKKMVGKKGEQLTWTKERIECFLYCFNRLPIDNRGPKKLYEEMRKLDPSLSYEDLYKYQKKHKRYLKRYGILAKPSSSTNPNSQIPLQDHSISTNPNFNFPIQRPSNFSNPNFHFPIQRASNSSNPNSQVHIKSPNSHFPIQIPSNFSNPNFNFPIQRPSNFYNPNFNFPIQRASNFSNPNSQIHIKSPSNFSNPNFNFPIQRPSNFSNPNFYFLNQRPSNSYNPNSQIHIKSPNSHFPIQIPSNFTTPNFHIPLQSSTNSCNPNSRFPFQTSSNFTNPNCRFPLQSSSISTNPNSTFPLQCPSIPSDPNSLFPRRSSFNFARPDSRLPLQSPHILTGPNNSNFHFQSSSISSRPNSLFYFQSSSISTNHNIHFPPQSHSISTNPNSQLPLQISHSISTNPNSQFPLQSHSISTNPNPQLDILQSAIQHLPLLNQTLSRCDDTNLSKHDKVDFRSFSNIDNNNVAIHGGGANNYSNMVDVFESQGSPCRVIEQSANNLPSDFSLSASHFADPIIPNNDHNQLISNFDGDDNNDLDPMILGNFFGGLSAKDYTLNFDDPPNSL